jgi:hypothetical protein
MSIKERAAMVAGCGPEHKMQQAASSPSSPAAIPLPPSPPRVYAPVFSPSPPTAPLRRPTPRRFVSRRPQTPPSPPPGDDRRPSLPLPDRGPPLRPAIRRPTSTPTRKRVKINAPPPKYTGPRPKAGVHNMSASFPQYCTMCEKQIMTPNVSLLYCSQHCRQKDTNKPLADVESSSLPAGLVAVSSHATAPQTPPPPRGARGSLVDATSPPADIVPRQSPTPRLANSLCFSSPYSLAEIAVQAHSAMPTLVTEYSYNTHTDLLIERDADGNRPGHRRQQSEAAKYLRLFHTPDALVDSPEARHFSRPVPPAHRASTASLAPSLSFSSLTRSPSSPGASPTSMTAREASLPRIDARPLPPRHHPYSTSYGARSIRLVSPFTRPASPQSLPVDVPRPAPIDVPRPLLPHTPSSDRLPMLKSLPSVGTDVGVESLPNALPCSNGCAESFPRGEAGSMKGGLACLFRFAAMQAPPTPP